MEKAVSLLLLAAAGGGDFGEPWTHNLDTDSHGFQHGTYTGH